jgi:hypothetical protein
MYRRDSEGAAPPQASAPAAFDPAGVWITDLTRCKPEHAIARKARKGHWRAVDYEARRPGSEFKGVMLVCGPETQAPPLVLPLEARGWHAIYVGLKPYLGIGEPNLIRLKLTSDPCYVPMSVEVASQRSQGEDIGLSRDAEVERVRLSRRQIQDCFYKFADLTGEELHISPQSAGLPQTCAIAYVRIVPLRAGQVAAIQAERAGRSNRRLVCLNDNLTFMHMKRPASREDIWEEIYPYKDTDYKAIYWTAVRGDNCLYPTRVGTVLGSETDDYPRLGDRHLAESLRNLIAKDIDPVRTALDFTRRLGMDFHLCLRVEAFTAEPPWDGVFRSKFFFDHPELRCVDHDGRTIARLSYAFEGTRRHMTALIRELAEYQPDGIMLVFPRAQPYVLYERPVMEEFRRRHGSPPAKIDERDPRMLQVRAELLTGFMREARRAIESAKSPHRIQFSAMVLANEDTNRFHAIDAAAWVREGIIDRLSPSPFSMIRSEAPIDIDYYSRITRGTSCLLSPTLRPSWLRLPDVVPLARKFYAAGASELIIFDVNLHHQFPTEWRVWQLVGRKDELPEIEKRLRFEHTASEITRLNNLVVDKYSPLWAW